jgi:hypothetical protein
MSITRGVVTNFSLAAVAKPSSQQIVEDIDMLRWIKGSNGYCLLRMRQKTSR